MKDFLDFSLNISIIILGVVLKEIFKVDAFLYLISVFWLYVITNTFVNKMHLTKEYIIILFFVSVVYTFAAYKLEIVIFATILQLVCGAFVNEANKHFQTEKEYIENKYLIRPRLSSKDLGL